MGAQTSASFDRESPTPHASHAAASFGDGETPGSAQNPYSRRVTQAEYTKKRKSKKRKKIVLAVCIALLVVVLGGVGAAFAYINTINANLNEGVDDDLRDALVDTKYAGDPFYMLLMGTDGSEERSESAEYAGDQFRSDSMILARIDPQNKQVTMVSLHRDTLIDMGTNGKQKLNAAHSIGGAAYTIEVVSKFAGVPISHYAEIDFDGFKDSEIFRRCVYGCGSENPGKEWRGRIKTLQRQAMPREDVPTRLKDAIGELWQMGRTYARGNARKAAELRQGIEANLKHI